MIRLRCSARWGSKGGTYAVTVMTDGSADESSGIELVEAVARRINEELTIGEPARHAVDEVVCIEMSSGQSWEAAATELGIADRDLLRLINGGEAAPLSGQRVCAP